MLHFTDRYPQRGTAYAPIALLQDHVRGKMFGYGKLEPDDAEHMNEGMLHELLFPEQCDIRGSGKGTYTYTGAAFYGEIFDILVPNLSNRPLDREALSNYKALLS